MPGLPPLKHLWLSYCTQFVFFIFLFIFSWKLHQVGRQICGRAGLRRREVGGEVAESTQGEFADFKNHVLCICHHFLSRNWRNECLQPWHLQDCSSAPPRDHRTKWCWPTQFRVTARAASCTLIHKRPLHALNGCSPWWISPPDALSMRCTLCIVPMQGCLTHSSS